MKMVRGNAVIIREEAKLARYILNAKLNFFHNFEWQFHLIKAEVKASHFVNDKPEIKKSSTKRS